MKQKKTGKKEKAGGRNSRKSNEIKRRHDLLEKRHNGSTLKIGFFMESYSRKTDEKIESYSKIPMKEWMTSQGKLMKC